MERVLEKCNNRIWKWYTEENLYGLKKEHLENGIDLDAFSHIAKHNRVAI